MIKFLLRNGVIGLGLSAENIRRLQGGKPMLFSLGELVPALANYEVLILYGATEESILADLRAAGIITERTEERG